MSDSETDTVEPIRALVDAVSKLISASRPEHAAPEPWIDVATAAAYASCSEDTIRELIASGALRAGRLGVRGIRVRRSDIDRALLSDQPAEPPDVSRAAAERILRSLRQPSGSAVQE